MTALSKILWDEPGRLETLLPRIDPRVARVLRGRRLGRLGDGGLLLGLVRGSVGHRLCAGAGGEACGER